MHPEWQKACLLREQGDQPDQMRNEMSQLTEKLRAKEMLSAQRATEIMTLREELERVRKRSQDDETLSQQNLEELQGRFDAERRSLHSEVNKERRERQFVEGPLRESKTSRVENLRRKAGNRLEEGRILRVRSLLGGLLAGRAPAIPIDHTEAVEVVDGQRQRNLGTPSLGRGVEK
jgi:hypothetical protein